MASNNLVLAALVAVASLLPTQYANSQNNPDETFTLNLENVDIYSFIESVSRRTGKNFIVDPRVKATVNVISSEPLNADKLYDLFLSVLEVNGYAAVQAGSFTKIVPVSVGIQSALPILNERSEAGNRLVSRVIQLKNIPALELIETLGPLLSDSASLSAENIGNTIVITDRAADIENLIKLITRMDNH